MVRHIDLKEVLKRTGAIKDNIDKAKWRTCQGVISVTGQKFINWSDGGIGGGGAIDLIIHLKQYDFKTAVSWLFDNFSISASQISNNIRPAIKPALRLPKKDDKKLSRITNYLKYDRFLPLELINCLSNLVNSTLIKEPMPFFYYLEKKKQLSEQSFAEQQRSDGVVWQPAQEKTWVASILKDHTRTKCCFVNLP